MNTVEGTVPQALVANAWKWVILAVPSGVKSSGGIHASVGDVAPPNPVPSGYVKLLTVVVMEDRASPCFHLAK